MQFSSQDLIKKWCPNFIWGKSWCFHLWRPEGIVLSVHYVRFRILPCHVWHCIWEKSWDDYLAKNENSNQQMKRVQPYIVCIGNGYYIAVWWQCSLGVTGEVCHCTGQPCGNIIILILFIPYQLKILSLSGSTWRGNFQPGRLHCWPSCQHCEIATARFYCLQSCVDCYSIFHLLVTAAVLLCEFLTSFVGLNFQLTSLFWLCFPSFFF